VSHVAPASHSPDGETGPRATGRIPGGGVLVPGNDLPPAFYEPLAGRLGFHVLALRGFCGEPAHPQPGWEATLNEVAGLFDGRVLMGHSFGGLIAFLFAARYPDRVERLVLIEPPLVPSPLVRRWATRRYIRQTVEGDRTRFHNWSGLTRRIADPRSFPPERLRDYLEARRRADSSTVLVLLSAVARGMPLDFARVDMPVLILRGASSGWVTSFGMRQLVRWFPNARLDTIPEAAHMMFNENDERLEEVIARFCSTETSPAGRRPAERVTPRSSDSR